MDESLKRHGYPSIPRFASTEIEMSRSKYEFQKIYEDYQPRIHRYLVRMVGEDESEDLTQEVFVKISTSLEDFRGESSISTWIYRIATNAAIDRLRSASFQQSVQSKPIDETTEQKDVKFADRDFWTGEKPLTVEQELVRKQMNDCIRDFIGNLPENYRTVLVLSELEGLPDREIAEILDISLNSVKIRLHRARQKLREELETHCDSYWLEDNEFVPDLKNALDEFKKIN